MSGGASILPLPEAKPEELSKEDIQKEALRRLNNLIPDMSHQIENLHKDKAKPTPTPKPDMKPEMKAGQKLASHYEKKEEDEDESGRPIPPTPVYGGA